VLAAAVGSGAFPMMSFSSDSEAFERLAAVLLSAILKTHRQKAANISAKPEIMHSLRSLFLIVIVFLS
jgi:hypothetical protein